MTSFNSEKNYLTSLGFTETAPDVFEKTMTKKVEVAFHGEMDSSLTVTICFRDDGSILADYAKNGRSCKRKVHSFGWTRTLNAIRETIENAGFGIRNDDNPKCSHTRDQQCENCNCYTYSDKTGTRVWCYGKTEEVTA